jgi:hypothetical protein
MKPEKVIGYSLEETRMETGGVLRCCIATVGLEYDGKTVKVGDKSKCGHCGEKFTLVENEGKRPPWFTEKEWLIPKWKPDWQIEKDKSNEPDKS